MKTLITALAILTTTSTAAPNDGNLVGLTIPFKITAASMSQVIAITSSTIRYTKKSIHLIINSNGGQLQPTKTLVDFMKKDPDRFSCSVNGNVISAAFYLMSFCRELSVAPRTAFMWHHSGFMFKDYKGKTIKVTALTKLKPYKGTSSFSAIAFLKELGRVGQLALDAEIVDNLNIKNKSLFYHYRNTERFLTYEQLLKLSE